MEGVACAVVLAVTFNGAALARVPASPEITATCGGGTPASFGPGAHVDHADAAIYQLDWANGDRKRIVARNRELVSRWVKILGQIGFEGIRYDHADKSWCGVVLARGESKHAVRWSTKLGANGTLEHHFEGMPPEVYFLYLQMQNVARTQEVCGEEVREQRPIVGSIAVSCHEGSGPDASLGGVRILADGEVVSWRTQQASGKTQQCSSVIGRHSTAIADWNALLNEARFEGLESPTVMTGIALYCELERSSGTGTHSVLAVAPGTKAERWAAVIKVNSELMSLALDAFPFHTVGRAETVQVRLRDAGTRAALANAEVYVANGAAGSCFTESCPRDDLYWRGRSDADGLVLVPKRFTTATTRIETAQHVARRMAEGSPGSDGALALELMPHGR